MRRIRMIKGTTAYRNLIHGISRPLCSTLTVEANEVTKSLFGLSEPLRRPSDFVALAIRAAGRINALREYLQQNNQDLCNSKKLMILDNISNELCSVMDAAELCRSVHMDEEFVNNAEKAFSELSNVIIDLNSDKHLYSVLERLLADVNAKKKLSEEELYFATDLLRDFKMEGIHFEKNDKLKLSNLQHTVVQHETTYNQNVITGAQGLIEVTLDRHDENSFHHLRRWLENSVEQPKLGNKPILYSTSDRRLLGPLMNSLSSPELRKSLWFENFVQPVSNFAPFAELVLSRHKLAKFLDYPNFLTKGIVKNVANERSIINDLLQSLSLASKGIAEKELKDLDRFKQDSELPFMNNIFSRIVGKDNLTIDPWDVGYLQPHVSNTQSSSSRKEEAFHRIKAYLSIGSCIDGIRYVTKHLFGLDMIEEKLDESEAWVNANEMNGVKKFMIYDQLDGGANNKCIGIVYFDLLQRFNKFPGAAHFTVRCGCEKITWSSLQSPREFLFGTPPSKISIKNQTPTVVLTFSFPRPQNQRLSMVEVNNTLLSLQDLETLFHEWGHALHSIFSKTKFQHLSGTRGGADFVEIPSHFMEFFARDPTVIGKWARHNVTGDRISPELLKDALAKKQGFVGIDLQHQILLSAADQFVFSGENIKELNDKNNILLRTVDGIAKLQADLTLLPLASTNTLKENIHDFPKTGSPQIKQLLVENLDMLPSINLFSHSHFINYGGSYYSYLFAKIYAAQIWHQMFAADPLNRDAGTIIRKELLECGCSKSPRDILCILAGSSLDPQYFLKMITDRV